MGEHLGSEHSARAQTWGGRRAGSGRKKGPWVEHSTRPSFERRRVPLLIECPLRSSCPSLQTSDLRLAFRRAANRARRFGLRVIQFSIRAHSIELICELRSRKDLERSLKSLNTTMALAVKKEMHKTQELRHRGRIFLDRFRLTLLESSSRVHAAFGKLFSGHSTTQLTRYSSAPLCAPWIGRLNRVFKVPKLKQQSKTNKELTEIVSSSRLRVLRLKTFLFAQG
jgi:hypothetical protein